MGKHAKSQATDLKIFNWSYLLNYCMDHHEILAQCCTLKAMLASESYLACLSMNHLFFKLIIKMQVFEHFLITGFISYAYCCHGNLHQQPKYITLRGNKYLRQIFSFRFLFFHPDIKIHLVSILSEGIFDKIFFLREK